MTSFYKRITSYISLKAENYKSSIQKGLDDLVTNIMPINQEFQPAYATLSSRNHNNQGKKPNIPNISYFAKRQTYLRKWETPQKKKIETKINKFKESGEKIPESLRVKAKKLGMEL